MAKDRIDRDELASKLVETAGFHQASNFAVLSPRLTQTIKGRFVQGKNGFKERRSRAGCPLERNTVGAGVNRLRSERPQ